MEMMNLNDYGHSAMPRGFYGWCTYEYQIDSF
jgi:hypothetical protein